MLIERLSKLASEKSSERRVELLREITDLFLDGVELHREPELVLLDELMTRIVDDVTEAARVVRALDLVVSVDSMPAHLAGALGVPVWNLLHADADWRWMEDREDSPWYPTMRLFRQPRPGDWPAVIARVARELESRAASRAEVP